MGETSCLSKRDGTARLPRQGPDLLGSRPRRVPAAAATSREPAPKLFSMGAGGSTIALTWHLMRPERGADRPSRIVVSNRSAAAPRRDPRASMRRSAADVPVDYVLAPSPNDNDRVMASPEAGLAGHQRDRARQGRAGLADHRRGAFSPKAASPGTSTIAATSSSSTRRARSRRRASCRSRTAGPISSMAGRR